MRRKIYGDEGDVRTEKCQVRLTVYFEDPFWVGVFERIENGKLSAAKVTFGAEPKDYEVQEFINRSRISWRGKSEVSRNGKRRATDCLS